MNIDTWSRRGRGSKSDHFGVVRHRRFFSLYFDGDETEDTAFNAVASRGESMQSKLESLGGSIGPVTVSGSLVGALEYS